MPIYEYKCTRCSECFEVKQSFSDDNTVVCHACGSEARRVFVPVPIFFKGPGFYVTDCAAEKEKSLVNKKNHAEAAEKPAATESKADQTKTADKTS
jgi:putative FmdB family regulatory protein